MTFLKRNCLPFLFCIFASLRYVLSNNAQYLKIFQNSGDGVVIMKIFEMSGAMLISLFSMMFIFGGLLSGCATTKVSPAVPPSFDASDYQALRLDARKLQLIDNWQMPMEPPYIEHTLEPNMSGLIIQWASRVLIPVGGSGKVILDISQASVSLTSLEKSNNVISLFSNQQESKIRVDIKARLMWTQPIGNKQSTVEIVASASKTVPETASPNDYDIATKQTMLDAIAKLDKHARMKIAEIPRIILP